MSRAGSLDDDGQLRPLLSAMADTVDLSHTERVVSSPSSIKKADLDDSSSDDSTAPVGVEHLAAVVPPHASYEGSHRYEPGASWSTAEEREVVFKTDVYLLSVICLMVDLRTPERPMPVIH